MLEFMLKAVVDQGQASEYLKGRIVSILRPMGLPVSLTATQLCIHGAKQLSMH